MQVIYKIAEKQRKTRAGFMQLMDYISRDSFKTFGVGTSDNKNIAIKHYLSNKDLHKKNRDGKDRFTYHVMASFGVDVPIETVIEIMEEFCTDNFYDKGFNSFFAIHTDTNNIHCHVIADNVNFETGNMIHSVTEKQYESMSQKKKDKAETFVYEHQRKLFEDICIKHGLDISLEERYEYMHEQKVKEGRTWLKKNEFRTIQDEKSWRNIIKNKLEEIYNREDLKEDNIQDIAREYGLQVTRHNADKKSITFALTDEKGNPSKKERIKLERLKEQEQELLLRDDKTKTNIFEYDIFFKGREKEEEKTREETIKVEAPDDSHTELESDSKTYNINKTNNERNYIVDTDEDKEKDKKDFEKEKEYKNKIEDFYEKQEEIKANKIEAQKKLDEQIKADEKNKLNKLDEANETLRRLSIEEIERQEIQKKLKKAKKYLFDELKDFKVITDELKILDKENKIKYTEYNFYNYDKAVVQVFESLVNKIEFNNIEEEERGKKIVKNIYAYSDKTSIKDNLEALDELISDNKKYKEEKIEAPDDSYIELESDTKTYNTSYEEEEKVEAPDDSYTELGTDTKTYNTSYKEEKVEAPDIDIDRILKNIDLYEIVKTNEIFDILPDFTIYNQDGTLLYNSETQEINHSEASYYVKDSKGEEYWDNMNFKDIKEWSEIETLIVVCGEEEYKGYEDYAEKTIKNFLKNNLDIAKALDDKTLISNDKQEIKLDKMEDKEIDFN